MIDIEHLGKRYGTFQVKMTTIRDDVRSVMEAFVAEQEAAPKNKIVAMAKSAKSVR